MTRAVGERRAGEGETGFERVMWVSGDEGCGRPRSCGLFWRALAGSESEACTARRPQHSGGRRAGAVLLRDAKRADARGGKEWRTAVAPRFRFWPSRHSQKAVYAPCYRPRAETSFPRRPFLLVTAQRFPHQAGDKGAQCSWSSRQRCGLSRCTSDAMPRDFRSSLKSFPSGTSSRAAMPCEIALVARASPASRPARSLSQAM